MVAVVKYEYICNKTLKKPKSAQMLVNEHIFQETIAQRAKAIRLEHNWTQAEVAERSGVSLGSLRRFEQTGEISLGNLYRISVALLRVNDWNQLFQPRPIRTIEEIERENNRRPRKRARKAGKSSAA